jgi:hypothetical protein
MKALANTQLSLSITYNEKLVIYLRYLLHHIVVLILSMLLFTFIIINSNIVDHISWYNCKDLKCIQEMPHSNINLEITCPQ